MALSKETVNETREGDYEVAAGLQRGLGRNKGTVHRDVAVWSTGPRAGQSVAGYLYAGQTGTHDIAKEDSGQTEQRHSLPLSTELAGPALSISSREGNENENPEFNRAEH